MCMHEMPKPQNQMAEKKPHLPELGKKMAAKINGFTVLRKMQTCLLGQSSEQTLFMIHTRCPYSRESLRPEYANFSQSKSCVIFNFLESNMARRVWNHLKLTRHQIFEKNLLLPLLELLRFGLICTMD